MGKIISLFLLFWGASSAFALSGTLKSSTDFYQQKLGPPTDQTSPFGQLELTDKHKFTKRFRLQWKFVALGNFEAEKPEKNEERLAHEQSFLDLPEAFVEYKAGSTKFRLGMNTVNWGVVDVSSPSNVINTSAFLSPMRLPRRGSPTAEIQFGGEKAGLTLLYIPRQPRAVLPARDSRWLPRDMLTNFPTGVGVTNEVDLPASVQYEYLADIEMDHARDHNVGVKVHSHVGSFDLQATYFEGASPFPKINPTVTLNTDPITNRFVASPTIGLAQVQYRVRNSGFGATYAGEQIIVRLESDYQHTISKGNGLQPWIWSNVFGVETNFEFGAKTLTLLTQYYHTEIPTKADNLISSSYRLFDRTAVLGLRFPASDAWTFSASGLLETKTHGLFWTAGIEWKLSDPLKMTASWRDFSATEPGLIKTFEKNDHANLDLTYYF